ncbi:MAG: hypothetical protein IJB93_00605, partial [Clostridia bacterium]|nr:hypothetical protein [Clostridia bacterium]
MKRFVAALLCLLMAFSVVSAAGIEKVFPSAEAVSYALTQVRKEIYNRNVAFRSYADKDIFDLEYFRTPIESAEKRAEYEKVVLDLKSKSATDAELVRNIYLVVTSYIYYDYDYYYNSSKGTFFEASDVFKNRRTVCGSGEIRENFLVPSGYNVLLNQVFWEIDKHSAEGTLEKIVE